ncbi:MAG: hypothetical protein IJS28_05500 [Synergistaceae bacterium]|nr:hypothetical protein [Synergistaceae bacterium]
MTYRMREARLIFAAVVMTIIAVPAVSLGLPVALVIAVIGIVGRILHLGIIRTLTDKVLGGMIFCLEAMSRALNALAAEMEALKKEKP